MDNNSNSPATSAIPDQDHCLDPAQRTAFEDSPEVEVELGPSPHVSNEQEEEVEIASPQHDSNENEQEEEVALGPSPHDSHEDEYEQGLQLHPADDPNPGTSQMVDDEIASYAFDEVDCFQWVAPYSLDRKWPRYLDSFMFGSPPTLAQAELMRKQLIREMPWSVISDPEVQGRIQDTLLDPNRGTFAINNYRTAHNSTPTYIENSGFDGITPSEASSNYLSCTLQHFLVTGLYAEVLTIFATSSDLDEEATSCRASALSQDLWKLCPNVKAVKLSGRWDQQMMDFPATCSNLPALEKVDVVTVEYWANDLIACRIISGPLRNTRILEVHESMAKMLAESDPIFPRLNKLKLNGFRHEYVLSLQPLFQGCPNLETLELCESDVPTPQIFPAVINSIIQNTRLKHLFLDESFFFTLSNQDDDMKVLKLLTVTLTWRSMTDYNKDILALFILSSSITINLLEHAQSLQEISDYAKGIFDPSTDIIINYI